MDEPIILMSDSRILDTLNFKPFRSIMQRRVIPFVPREGQSQTMEIFTPWGTKLTAKKGDLLISELESPNDMWPIDAEIFDQSYILVGPGICIKRAITLLAPMTDLTEGDEDKIVLVHTLEGVESVRAGDFFLAKGVKGEIWPYPKEKVLTNMKPAE
jgi:hypothetical protein